MMNTDKYKKLLEEEKKRLEAALESVAERNPVQGKDGEEDWVPTPPVDIGHEADPIDQADEIEEYDERIGIEKPLEEQLHKVTAALSAIAGGTYGTCTVGGKPHPIETERLDANPSADTCIDHMNVVG